MAVILNKENDKNSELTQRINADLRERAERKSGGSGRGVATKHGDNDPDFIEGAEYMRDLEKTGRFGWVWIMLVVVGLVILIGVGVSMGGK